MRPEAEDPPHERADADPLPAVWASKGFIGSEIARSCEIAGCGAATGDFAAGATESIGVLAVRTVITGKLDAIGRFFACSQRQKRRFANKRRNRSVAAAMLPKNNRCVSASYLFVV